MSGSTGAYVSMGKETPSRGMRLDRGSRYRRRKRERAEREAREHDPRAKKFHF